MKHKFLLVLFLAFFTSAAASAQWAMSTTGAAGYYQISTVQFLNSTTGFMGGFTSIFGGDGRISKTTNGGATWTLVKTFTGFPIRELYFVNANLGFAVGNKGLIAKTTNGGTTWTTINFTSSGLQEDLHAVHFVDANTGYAAGGFNDQWVLKTTNGGTTWTKLNLPTFTFQRLHSVHFTSASTGYTVGGDMFGGGQGRVYFTNNGGTTWDTLRTNTATYFEDVYFINATTGFVGAYNGVILKTSNGGQTWNKMVNQDPSLDDVLDITFVNATTGYATTFGGKILKTINTGATWTVNGNFSGSMFSINAISVPTLTFGMATGVGAGYLKMTGATGIEEFINESKVNFYPNPAKEKLHVTIGPARSLMITDLQGKEVLNQKFGSGADEWIDISHLKKGMYLVLLETSRGRTMDKLVVE